MDGNDIVRTSITAVAAVITATTVIIQLRKFLPEWQEEDLKSLKTLVELRNLFDVSDPDYHRISAFLKDRIAVAFPHTPRRVNLEGHLGELAASLSVAVVSLFFAGAFFTAHHPWLGAVCIFITIMCMAGGTAWMFEPSRSQLSGQQIQFIPSATGDVLSVLEGAANGHTLSETERVTLREWLRNGVLRLEPEKREVFGLRRNPNSPIPP